MISSGRRPEEFSWRIRGFGGLSQAQLSLALPDLGEQRAPAPFIPFWIRRTSWMEDPCRLGNVLGTMPPIPKAGTAGSWDGQHPFPPIFPSHIPSHSKNSPHFHPFKTRIPNPIFNCNPKFKQIPPKFPPPACSHGETPGSSGEPFPRSGNGKCSSASFIPCFGAALRLP